MPVYERSRGLVKGLFWGGLIGAVIGLLHTTKRDKETLEDIGKSADALYNKTKDQIEQARRKLAELANRGKDFQSGEEESLKKAEPL